MDTLDVAPPVTEAPIIGWDAQRCAQKTAYADRKTAYTAAQQYRQQHYRCYLCGQWHLTSRGHVRRW
jgi:hypothetical protein